jgi:DNA-binding transcriptional ArsR family regulator
MVDALSETFSALADPTRRAILARLAHGEATVSELAAPHDISLPAVSRHLRVLERAGLISQVREAQWRPRRLESAAFQQADEWLSTYRDFFDRRLDRLEDHLETMVAERDHPHTATKGTGK